MRISDWSSDVCSSDLGGHGECPQGQARGRTRAVRASAQGSARSLRRGHAGASRPKKIAVPVGQGRGMIATIQQGLKDDGFAVSISQLCRWFGVPRRTVYYKPTKENPRTPIRRSEERRVGNECVRTFLSGWSQEP